MVNVCFKTEFLAYSVFFFFFNCVFYVYFSSGNAQSTSTTTARYCTPAEIEAKRERARRTLLLKFKSKNRSVS